jgi:F420-dependent oxidoreductase-like protein
MRMGLMVGPERGRYATKVERMRADVRWAEDSGFSTVWIPQIPDEFDALTAATLAGAGTSRIEIGTAVVPVQPRHPVALAQQALSTQVVCEGRLTLGLGVSHHWVIDEMLGLPYEHPVATMRAYLDVLEAAFAGPGMVDVENEAFRVHNPLDITDITPTPILLAALGPRMLELCGERTGGTILWMADERAIGDYVVPSITKAAQAAGRAGIRVVAGVPVALCSDSEVDDARAYASGVLGHADFSPNYVRLLEHGDAEDVGDTMAVGDESAVLARLKRYRDAGVTDLAARVVPLGDDAKTRSKSRRRTQEFLASVSAV